MGMTCLDSPKAELPSAGKLLSVGADRFGKSERAWTDSLSLHYAFSNFLGGLTSF